MKSIIILVICYTVVHVSPENAEKTNQPAGFNEEYIFGLQRRYFEGQKILERIDELLASEWNGELDKIFEEDLDSVELNSTISKNDRYQTAKQEWLLESGSTSRTIGLCLQKVLSDIAPKMSQSELDSLNRTFEYHIKAEALQEEMFDRYLESSSREQVPFRKFIGWDDFVEMMFQNRTPDALSDLETDVFERGSQIVKENRDRIDPTFITDWECNWKNAKALIEAPSEDARFAEFTRQIRDYVNQNLGYHIVWEWSMNDTLSRSQHDAWVKAREKMMLDIDDEVAKLRTQKKDAQWLCKRATHLGNEFTQQQRHILFAEQVSLRRFSTIREVAERSRKMKVKLVGTKDFRQTTVKILAEQLENATMCFQAFVDLVEKHHRLDIAMAVSDEGHYTYAMFFCNKLIPVEGAIITFFCKCIGTFCSGKALGLLPADQYVLIQEPDGTFNVARNGLFIEL